jgi:N utilization substance protein B
MAESEAVAAEPVAEKPRGAARHSAREVALQVLYAIDLRNDARRLHPDADQDPDVGDGRETAPDSDEEARTRSPAVPTDAVFDRIAENFSVPAAAAEFARELVEAVVHRSDLLDELLGIHARNWRVSRMAAVDRNVLRMAAYELRDTETPVAVIIDEAVDLARRFGSDTSPAFVNGVLDAVAREVRSA